MTVNISVNDIVDGSATERYHDHMPQTRISEQAHRTLRRLCTQTGATSEQVIDTALELLERDRLLTAINAGFAALRRDETAWADATAELEVWDVALRDGLDP